MSEPGSARLVVFAGPNGAGKSTLISLQKYDFQILDPDKIARRLSSTGRQRSIEAGRIMHDAVESCIQERQTFGIETTLSGRTILNNMRRAKVAGMGVDLHYVGLESRDLSALRVHQRVVSGGHGIPAEDIERRFERTLENLAEALLIGDQTHVYDNSALERFRLVGKFSNGEWHKLDTSVEWLMKIVAKN